MHAPQRAREGGAPARQLAVVCSSPLARALLPPLISPTSAHLDHARAIVAHEGADLVVTVHPAAPERREGKGCGLGRPARLAPAREVGERQPRGPPPALSLPLCMPWIGTRRPKTLRAIRRALESDARERVRALVQCCSARAISPWTHLLPLWFLPSLGRMEGVDSERLNRDGREGRGSCRPLDGRGRGRGASSIPSQPGLPVCVHALLITSLSGCTSASVVRPPMPIVHSKSFELPRDVAYALPLARVCVLPLQSHRARLAASLLRL